MNDIDFTRDGKVGDKVHDIVLGNGVIKKINASMQYCIECTIEGHPASYTSKGMAWNDDVLPYLCWGHRKHVDQGHPPERFEYPLYMRGNSTSLVLKFTGMTEATVVVAYDRAPVSNVIHTDYVPHTNRDVWTPCDKPVWKPTKPTWCLVGDREADWIEGVRLLVIDYVENTSCPYITSNAGKFRYAKPCDERDIPDWWPKEWA